MVTVLRAEGLRIIIYLNDHRPAHVHVIGDGEAKIDIADTNGPILVWADRMTRSDIRRSMRIVADHQTALPERWTTIHG